MFLSKMIFKKLFFMSFKICIPKLFDSSKPFNGFLYYILVNLFAFNSTFKIAITIPFWISLIFWVNMNKVSYLSVHHFFAHHC